MDPREVSANFNKYIQNKYTIYNSFFASLPYSGVANVGSLLPILHFVCTQGYIDNKNPIEIIDYFFEKYTNLQNEAEKLSVLFKFIQYIERQIVLFDAIEDASFNKVNDLNGKGTLKYFINETFVKNQIDELKNALNTYKIKLVLTAHPTQFYPNGVLSIIQDMNQSIAKNDSNAINEYISQLGLTPFFNKKKPTPIDEATNLMWYLENVFYNSITNIYTSILKDLFNYPEDLDSIIENFNNPFIELGFWPGGDRDGNPNVNHITTLQVAQKLRKSIMACYYKDIRKLKRRLTFSKIDIILSDLENKIYDNLFSTNIESPISSEEIINQLKLIRAEIKNSNYNLFIHLVENLIYKVKLFGTHFASIDIRQDSRIHTQVLTSINNALIQKNLSAIFPENYADLSEDAKINILTQINTQVDVELIEDGLAKDTLQTIQQIIQIQQLNGELCCNRYIISNCQSIVHIFELYALCILGGFKSNLPNLDIIPLFETINDLKKSEQIMQHLFTTNFYKTHLLTRANHQIIMLGFSDGTKDGGYFQANWSIYKAKETLSILAKKQDILVSFFDGRGGPPSRGGGKTHKFYASLDKDIANEEIQITIQGQTITSNFGTNESAKFNIEQLLTAGLKNKISKDDSNTISDDQRFIFETIADISFEKYVNLKNDENFLPYLQKISPINFYSDTNIASRPTKRNKDDKLRLEDLRAIPFVGGWSQIKQNVPGFYGVGSALFVIKKIGKWEEVKLMYKNNNFFNTLIDNSMMSMIKSSFNITQYIQDDPIFATIWKNIKDEYDLTYQLYLELSETDILMQNDKVGKKSIDLRENIVLPLLTIQQYGLMKLRNLENTSSPLISNYQKLITRSMFGIINAARNSV